MTTQQHNQHTCCIPDAYGRCITCADEAIAAIVLQVDLSTATALVSIDGSTSQVDISLVEPPHIGDRVLVHAGVALTTL